MAITEYQRQNYLFPSVSDGSSYKRSRSEDNILQVNEEFTEDADAMVTCTPMLIGEAMCRDDPFYQPSISNPFAVMAGFCKGGKILGKSFCDVDGMVDNMFELPSPSSPDTPPCTPNLLSQSVSTKKTSIVQVQRKSQSLPSSPVLLRKAAERLHQESIHGSNCKKSINPNRYSFSAYSSRSKSVFFPEAVAQKLQFEMFDTGSPCNGRSRESSVESDNNMNYINSRPRRHSNLEGIQKCKLGDNSSKKERSMTPEKVILNEKGDNQSNLPAEKSIYPGLNYALDSAKKEVKCVNNNNLTSPIEHKVFFEDQFTPGLKSCLKSPDTDPADPWTMRREKYKTKSTTIIEEAICTPELMETSV